MSNENRPYLLGISQLDNGDFHTNATLELELNTRHRPPRRYKQVDSGSVPFLCLYLDPPVHSARDMNYRIKY